MSFWKVYLVWGFNMGFDYFVSTMNIGNILITMIAIITIIFDV